MADPTLYLYTSLTAGSSHIITATSRLETILKANKIPFRALDCATDEKARTLWGRRSRGRKLPGLVKFGQVIGDLEQIEEWNEFGELHDQLDSVDDFLDSSAAPTNPNAITLRPEPAAGVANQLTPIQPAPGGAKKDAKDVSGASSRASSETRHISISEPTALEREGRSPLKTPSENPMAMTMRQLGAEAAAKAKDGQRKASTPTTKPAPAVEAIKAQAEPAEPPTPETAAERAAADPKLEPEVTAAKMPAQLAAEGAKRTSVDKLEADNTTTEDKSTEEQVLQLRRESTQTAVPSKLASSVSAEPDNEPEANPELSQVGKTEVSDKIDEDVEPPVAEGLEGSPKAETDVASVPLVSSEKKAASETPAAEVKSHTGESAAALASIDDSPAGTKPRSHRGSSVEAADKEKIKEIEQSIKIEEHPEEHESAVETDDKPQETAAKDPEAASKSVGD